MVLELRPAYSESAVIIWLLFVLSSRGGNYVLSYPSAEACQHEANAERHEGNQVQCVKTEIQGDSQ